MPLYLLTVFAKNERANLNQAERNPLAGLVELLVKDGVVHFGNKPVAEQSEPRWLQQATPLGMGCGTCCGGRLRDAHGLSLCGA